VTRIWTFSDLHVDSHAAYDPFGFGEHPDHDLILCAGDLCNGDFDVVPWLLEQFSDDERSRFAYVPGNHDYWRIGLGAGRERLRRIAGETGITVLDDAVAEIAGVRVVGTTLWSDLAMDPWIERDIGDFLHVAGFTPAEWRARHAEAVRFLESEVRPGDVVATHFSPSFEGMSTDMQHNPRLTALSSAVMTPLEDLAHRLRPGLWVHGHTHVTREYSMGGTPVLTNAKGVGPGSLFEPGLVYDPGRPEALPDAGGLSP